MTSSIFDQLFRDAIGYDSLNRFAGQPTQQAKYPPHNIIKMDDNTYQLEIAVAGFTRGQLSVTQDDNYLVIVGTTNDHHDDDGKIMVEYLYRGIAARSFQRSWQLGEYINVSDTKLQDGMLYVTLQRDIPENKKPRLIEIS